MISLKELINYQYVKFETGNLPYKHAMHQAPSFWDLQTHPTYKSCSHWSHSKGIPPELDSKTTRILPFLGKIIESFGGPRHLSTISLKNFHLFKTTESVINLYFKKNF